METAAALGELHALQFTASGTETRRIPRLHVLHVVQVEGDAGVCEACVKGERAHKGHAVRWGAHYMLLSDTQAQRCWFNGN